MYILVDSNSNVCNFTGNTIEYGTWEESFKKWKITNDIGAFYVIGDYLKCIEVESLPSDYVDMKYCYNETDGFYLNPDYVEPYDIDAEVKKLTEENKTLKTTVSNLESKAVEAEIETDYRLSMLELGLA